MTGWCQRIAVVAEAKAILFDGHNLTARPNWASKSACLDTAAMTQSELQKSWLSYANFSDYYERKARFVPALLTWLFLLPLSAAFSAPLGGWLNVVIAGVGVGAVVAVGLSHLASAAGNRLQFKIWPRWPHDSPTNRWLCPNDQTRSAQQKAQWHAEILRLTGLDISEAVVVGDEIELERVINDAVSKLRYLLRDSSHADRLRLHNADYGFARNFTGLRSVWVAFALVSCVGSWCAVLFTSGELLWAVISSLLLVGAVVLALVLPGYVAVRANSYAESFFGAMSLHSAEQERGSQPAPPSKLSSPPDRAHT